MPRPSSSLEPCPCPGARPWPAASLLHRLSAAAAQARARLSSSASPGAGLLTCQRPAELTSVASAVLSLFLWRVRPSALSHWVALDGVRVPSLSNRAPQGGSSARSAGSEGEGLGAEVCLVRREGAQRRGRTAVTVGGSHHDGCGFCQACKGPQATSYRAF